MSTLWHMHWDIEGALRWSDEDLAGMMYSEGKTQTGAEARQELLRGLAKGWKVFPVGKCPTFCYQNGCPGHEETKDVKL